MTNEKIIASGTVNQFVVRPGQRYKEVLHLSSGMGRGGTVGGTMGVFLETLTFSGNRSGVIDSQNLRISRAGFTGIQVQPRVMIVTLDEVLAHNTEEAAERWLHQKRMEQEMRQEEEGEEEGEGGGAGEGDSFLKEEERTVPSDGPRKCANCDGLATMRCSACCFDLCKSCESEIHGHKAFSNHKAVLIGQ